MKVVLFLFLLMGLIFSPTGMAKKHKKKAIKHAPIVLTPTELFIQAEKAFDLRNFSKFEEILPKLKNYPLYPYLLHKKLSRAISQHQANSLEVNEFVHLYADSPLSKQLADQWLALQAHKKNWSNYLSLYEAPKQEEKEHKYQCYGLWAKYQSNGDIDALYPAIQFWHAGLPEAQSCHIIFEELLTKNKLSYTDIWHRIERALQKKQPKVAESVLPYLSFEDKKIVRLWLKIHANPYLISNNLIIDLNEYEERQFPFVKKIIAHGMIGLIKQDVAYAIKIYPEIINRYAFSSQQEGEIARAFAISFAKKRSPLAKHWFREVPKKLQDSEYVSWKIRYELYQENWVAVLHTLQDLPPQEANHPRWQYWKARALDELGQKSQAANLFQQLFYKGHFYAFLAHHYCKQPLSLPLGHATIADEHIHTFNRQASIARIKTLLALSRIQQAKREWLYKINFLTEEEKIEAARFAHHMQWHDFAIATLANSQDKNTLRLRFPLAHHPKIVSESTKHAIDPAWVFAVTRQESTFIPSAQSPVGAMGLMQLMPKTAQEVAKTLKKRFESKQDLVNPNLNIELGTAYLKNLHHFMQGNPVLATASYNAGPGRIKQWLPNNNMTADIWIENIPFEETRNYVQNVITYTGIYRNILGKAIDLENILPDISS